MKTSVFILLCSMLIAMNTKAQDLTSIIPDTVADGPFTMSYGKMTISGHFKDSLPTGNWVTYFPTGQVHVVEYFRQGKRDGIYFKISRRGSIEEQAEYRLGKLHGQKVDFNPGGKVRLIENYSNGKLDGQRTVFYKKGTVQEESFYRNGEKDSTSKWYDTKGNIIAEYNYKAGAFDGWQHTWYANDVLKSEQFYIDNVADGEFKLFFSNGQLKENGVYQNGLKVGKWTVYDEKGKIIRETRFKKGKQINEKNY
jgi:antitoxin component YwqK of YwqJK toxin-antitoxin module